MKAEDKVRLAIDVYTGTVERRKMAKDQLLNAEMEVQKASEELQRVCHAVFGGSAKSIIYGNTEWIYHPNAELVCKEWHGIVLEKGSTK